MKISEIGPMNDRFGDIYYRVLVKKMSGVPVQLSGDTFYMSSTLIKVMLFIP